MATFTCQSFFPHVCLHTCGSRFLFFSCGLATPDLSISQNNIHSSISSCVIEFSAMASGSPTSRVQPYRSSSQGPIGSLPGYVGSYGPLGSGAATSVSAHSFALGLGLTTHLLGVTPLPHAIPPTAASFRHGSGAPFRSRNRNSRPGRHRRTTSPGPRSGSQYARASDLYPPGAGPRMLPGGPHPAPNGPTVNGPTKQCFPIGEPKLPQCPPNLP